MTPDYNSMWLAGFGTVPLSGSSYHTVVQFNTALVPCATGLALPNEIEWEIDWFVYW